MDPVGAQLAEQACVVGDGEDAELRVAGQRDDSLGEVAQGVDVEAGVKLVEEGDPRLEHRELQGLHAFLLPAGELVVDASGEELGGDFEACGFALHGGVDAAGVAAAARDRRAEQHPDGDARDRDRVLHGDEQAELGAPPGR